MEKKIVNVRAAAGEICSGDTLWVGGSDGAAGVFLEALAARAGELENVTVLVVTGREPCPALETLKRAPGLRALSFFSEAVASCCTGMGRAELMAAPAEKMLSIVCRSFGVDTVVVPVTLPDGSGRCSVGQGAAFAAPAVCALPGVHKRVCLIDPKLIPASGRLEAATVPFERFELIASGDPEAVPSGRPAAGVIKSFAELTAAETQQSQ